MGDAEEVGFIGLGKMGEPMVLNLLKAGIRLVVWNRTEAKSRLLALSGARLAASPEEVFACCKRIILMLRDAAATDGVLARQADRLGVPVAGRLVINMATPAPGYSADLARLVTEAGGRYVEAPVSGSRKPAEAAQLAAMLAGAPDAVAEARPLIAHMCRDAVVCGAIPNALRMKLAVNLYMIAMVTGLAEAVHFASHHSLDLDRLTEILELSPMASSVSRVKALKLVARDFAAQASIANVFENVELIAAAARERRVASPLLDLCHTLYGETRRLGLDEADMVAVIRAIEQRSARE